jgi:Cupin-like domain
VKSETEIAQPLDRVSNLSAETFVSEYLQKNRPVVVAGAMQDWKALETWTPEVLAKRFGSEQVQVYGDLFRLAGITSLSEYLTKYFGRQSGEAASAPYVRWYCHMANDERVPWADGAFDRFRDDWARPSFFPSHSFVLPYCHESRSIDPSRDWFPARGLFISAQGARTRLHKDPWCSDALLCQIFGKKDFVMYHPSQAPYLTNSGKTVDLEEPDLTAFPDFPKAHPTVKDTLKPGEIALVPAGWFHHFNSVADSISLTWNFVHTCRLKEFVSYLLRCPDEREMKQLTYAYFESPGVIPAD